jgi:outer membrane biosynthesis protein TonB
MNMSTALAHDTDDIYQHIDKCHGLINACQAEIKALEVELQSVDGELQAIADERKRYNVLSNITASLEELKECGGNELFWTGLVEADQVEQHLSRLRDKVNFFERRIKKVTDRRDVIQGKIAAKKDYIAGLLDEIDELKEREEEAKHEYIVDREIKLVPNRVVVMPWTKQGKDEKKFRKILLIVMFITLLFGLLVPLYKISIPDRTQPVKIPERLAKLVKKEKPKPKPEKKKPEQVNKEVKKEEKKKPTKEERKQAREKVKSKGVLAFKNNFADLLDDASLENLGANANLSNAGSTAKRTKRSVITAQATSSSSGIKSSSLSKNTAGTGEQIEAVAFSRVQSDIGTAVAEDRPLSDGPGPSRTDEEIQIVFDKYKSALYRIYNKQLRVNPTLQGKVVLRITIAADGSVSLCNVESTDMEAKKLLDKIVARVKRFNFGAKEGVPPTTILYPIDFLPAS